MNTLKELTPFIKHLCEESGFVIRKYFRTADLQLENKKDFSPVTIADKKAEEVIRALIEKEFPEHGILGEEFGESKTNAEYRWVIDPIDGTKSFICGTPLFGTLIALVQNGAPILGAIHQPILNDLTIGDNQITKINGIQTFMRKPLGLENAVAITTDVQSILDLKNSEKFLGLMKKVKYLRTWGDAYGYYLLASGQADIMLDPIVNPWDMMAVIPVIRGAGGVISEWEGGEASTGNSLIAAHDSLHKSILGLLN